MPKSEQAVPVWVNDQRLGTFERVDRDRHALAYDAEYQADDWNHPLSPSRQCRILCTRQRIHAASRTSDTIVIELECRCEQQLKRSGSF